MYILVASVVKIFTIVAVFECVVVFGTSDQHKQQHTCQFCFCELQDDYLRVCSAERSSLIELSPSQRKYLAENAPGKVTGSSSSISSITVILRGTTIDNHRDHDDRGGQKSWCHRGLIDIYSRCCRRDDDEEEESTAANRRILEINSENFASCWIITTTKGKSNDDFELFEKIVPSILRGLTTTEQQNAPAAAKGELVVEETSSSTDHHHTRSSTDGDDDHGLSSSASATSSISGHSVIVILVIASFLGVTVTAVLFFLCRFKNKPTAVLKFRPKSTDETTGDGILMTTHRRGSDASNKRRRAASQSATLSGPYDPASRRHTVRRTSSVPTPPAWLVVDQAENGGDSGSAPPKRSPVKKVSFADCLTSV